jgi:hypothetical protein
MEIPRQELRQDSKALTETRIEVTKSESKVDVIVAKQERSVEQRAVPPIQHLKSEPLAPIVANHHVAVQKTASSESLEPVTKRHKVSPDFPVDVTSTVALSNPASPKISMPVPIVGKKAWVKEFQEQTMKEQ